MNIWRLITQEMRHRKVHTALILLSITIAVAGLVGAWTILQAHDLRTEQIMSVKEAETQAQMKKLEDDYRKITKNLGFNLLIVPKQQDLNDLYANQYATAFMPESYVDTLSNSGLMTIRHLLPNIQQKVKWPERRRTVILTGVRGEVPLTYRKQLEPLLLPVPPGTAVLGYELHNSLHLSEGDPITFMGQTFTIKTCNPERGSKDDITLWIDLKTAQQLLNKPNQLTGIHALKCYCYGERLGNIRGDIERLLPDTRVIEFASEIITRAEARDRAADMAKAALAAEKTQRARLRSEREAFASILVPVIMLAGGLWIGLLSYFNVRERRAEIGMLRAIGIQTHSILTLFLGKALILGCMGALLGYLLGWLTGITYGDVQDPALLFNIHTFLIGLGIAPLLSTLSSWIPALLAGQQDPADILREI